jgi:hypothetical protein
MLPEYNVARPPEPIVIVGAPLISRFPPVAVPAAVAFPALRISAEVPVLVVAIFWATVKSPLKVSMRTGPVALMPVVAPTVPMVNALLSA